MKTITAIYENGVFRPNYPVDLPEGATVRIMPEMVGTPQERARRRVFETRGRLVLPLGCFSRREELLLPELRRTLERRGRG